MFSYINSRNFGFRDMVSIAWAVFTKQFPAIILLILITMTLVNVGLELIPDSVDSVAELGILFTGLAVVLFLSLFLATLFSLSLISLTVKTVRGEQVDFKSALQFGVDHWVSGILLSLLLGVIIFLFTLALIIPGIIFGVYYIFSLQALAVRDRRGMNALRYSKGLVSGQWWRIFGYLLLLGVIFGIINLLVTQILGYVPYGSLIALYVNDIITSFTMIAITVLFLNLDRKEDDVVVE